MSKQLPTISDENVSVKEALMAASSEDGLSEDPMDAILTYRPARFEDIHSDDSTERFHAEFPCPNLAFSPTFTLDVTTRFEKDDEKRKLHELVKTSISAGFAFISTGRIDVSDSDWEDSEDEELGDACGVIVFKFGLLKPIKDKTNRFDILTGFASPSVSGSEKNIYRADKTATGHLIARKFWIHVTGDAGSKTNVRKGDNDPPIVVDGEGWSHKVKGKKMIVSAQKGTVRYHPHGLFHPVRRR